MKLYIKNMVSNTCKMVVKFEIEKIGLICNSSELGEVEICEDISPQQYIRIKIMLQTFGFELLNDKKSILVEKIRNAIVESVHYSDSPIKIKFSNYLSDKLKCSYGYLAKKFLETHGTTIEKHVISQKIERAKELLIYDELSITEIALKLNYSSVAHLCTQFKKVTGHTPSGFKEAGHQKRFTLESVGSV